MYIFFHIEYDDSHSRHEHWPILLFSGAQGHGHAADGTCDRERSGLRQGTPDGARDVSGAPERGVGRMFMWVNVA